MRTKTLRGTVIFMTKKNRLRIIIVCAAAFIVALTAGYNIKYDPFGIVEGMKQLRYEEKTRVPILMYHNFGDEGLPEVTISADAFEIQIKALADAGYTAVSFDALCDYVYNGAPLPERPVMITIDDGYIGVYDIAYPILEKYGMTATVFIIGVFHGKSLYKENPYWQIIPHFGDAEAFEMASSGALSIQSHSYDMHHYEPYEEVYRDGVLRMRRESRAAYIEAFTSDFESAAEQIKSITGTKPYVYAYPFGKHTRLSESLLKEMGVKVTLTTVSGVSVVGRGAPQSLFKLKRHNVSGNMTAEELLEKIA